jgi:hypothetical protein
MISDGTVDEYWMMVEFCEISSDFFLNDFLPKKHFSESLLDRLLLDESKRIVHYSQSAVSLCALKNGRRTMEDRHVIRPCLASVSLDAGADADTLEMLNC